MKLLKLFLLSALVFTVAACSSDDDGPAVVELNSANLAGTYEVTFFEGSSSTSAIASNGNSVEIESETFTTDTFTNAIFTFNADGTYTSSGFYRITYVLTVPGQPTETEEEIVTLDDSGSYSTNNVSRTITFDSDSVEDVVLFDGNRLNIKGESTETENDLTYSDEYEIRLVRQN